jgi:hypothetical protein
MSFDPRICNRPWAHLGTGATAVAQVWLPRRRGRERERWEGGSRRTFILDKVKEEPLFSVV